MKRCLPVAAVILGIGMATPGLSCSVVAGYRIPTGLNLVDQAEGIMIARVDNGGKSGTPGFNKVKLTRIGDIKGNDLPDVVEFDEAVIANEIIKATPSDPRNLVDANPDAFSGSCNRVVFKEGMILVAFIMRIDGRWAPDMTPFARTLEDVSSPDALWVKTVKLYARIAALPKTKRHKEMERQRDYLGFTLDDPDSRLMSLELDRALHARN